MTLDDLKREASARSLRKRQYTSTLHGLSRTRLYAVWMQMRCRCQTPSHRAYRFYGAMGIKVCDEWQTFMPFCLWALSSGYELNLEIDRIDSSKGYCPENCRWVEGWEQATNVRRKKNPSSKRSSKYRGVGIDNGSYYAEVQRNGVRIRIGPYQIETDAAIAYNDLAKRHHGRAAILNVVCQSDIDESQTRKANCRLPPRERVYRRSL